MVIDLAAKEEERVWVKRQTDGELDDSRLTEGLTGEATVYKRRGMEKPELGRPQIKYVARWKWLEACFKRSAHTFIVGRREFASYSTFQPQCIDSSTMVVCKGAWKQVCEAMFMAGAPLDVHAAVMLMETFDRLSHKEKYVWDVSLNLVQPY